MAKAHRTSVKELPLQIQETLCASLLRETGDTLKLMTPHVTPICHGEGRAEIVSDWSLLVPPSFPAAKALIYETLLVQDFNSAKQSTPLS